MPTASVSPASTLLPLLALLEEEAEEEELDKLVSSPAGDFPASLSAAMLLSTAATAGPGIQRPT